MYLLNKGFGIFILYIILLYFLYNIIVFFLKIYWFNHRRVHKFTKINLLQVLRFRLQPSWLGRIDQISRTKRLTDYPRHKPYPQVTWVFWNHHHWRHLWKTNKKAVNFFLMTFPSHSMAHNHDTPELKHLMNLPVTATTSIYLKF